MRIILISMILFTSLTVVIGQPIEDYKARLYFTEAQKNYNQADFITALDYLKKAEDELGKTNARIVALKVDAHFSLGNFVTAKNLIDLYTNNYLNSASSDLTNQVMKNYISIEEGAERMLKKMENLKFDEGIAILESNGKYGLVDDSGNRITPMKYDHIELFDGAFAEITIDDKEGLINRNGEEIVPPEYDYIRPFFNGVALVSLNGNYGYIDESGNKIIPPIYDHIGPLGGDSTAICRQDGDNGVIDIKGRKIIACVYSSITYDAINEIYIVANRVRTGEAAIPGLTDGYANRYGILDDKGELVAPVIYSSISKIREIEHKVAYSKSGAVLLSPKGDVLSKQYSHMDQRFMFGDLIPVKSSSGKYGFIDLNGQEVIPCTLPYSEVSGFSDDLALVREPRKKSLYSGNHVVGDKYAYIDKRGKKVIPYKKYLYTESFHSGLAKITKKSGEVVFIDKNGTEVFMFSHPYETVFNFSDNRALFGNSNENNPQYGFIDKTGSIVIEPKYKSVNKVFCDKPHWISYGTLISKGFENGLAIGITLDDKYELIDTNGNRLNKKEYEYIGCFEQGLAYTISENGFAYINVDGEEVINVSERFDYGSGFYSDGLAKVFNDKEVGFINKNGEVLHLIKIGFPFDSISKSDTEGSFLVYHDSTFPFWVYIEEEH